jgi:hypothetical protein
MTMEVGMRAGSVGDVGELGDEWSFTLFDKDEREIVAFVFESEGDARRAAKAMQMVVAEALALAPPENQPNDFAVPIRRRLDNQEN